MNQFSLRLKMIDETLHRMKRRQNCVTALAYFALFIGIAVYGFSDLPAVATIMPAVMVLAAVLGFNGSIEIMLQELHRDQCDLRGLEQYANELDWRERRLLERESEVTDS